MNVHDLTVADLFDLADRHVDNMEEAEVREGAAFELVQEWIAAPDAFAGFVRDRANEDGTAEDEYVREALAEIARHRSPFAERRAGRYGMTVPASLSPSIEITLFDAADIRPGEVLVVRSVRPAGPDGEPVGAVNATVVSAGAVWNAVAGAGEEQQAGR